MRLTILPRGLFILALLTACVNKQSPVNVTEAPPVSDSLSTETAIPATQSSDLPGEVNALTGKIVYSTEGDVYVINADGSERTRLTDNPAEDFDPVWSPDGTQIAFRSHRDGNEEVYVMDAAGSNQLNISNASGGDYSPAWSPDGSRILFTHHGELYLMNADGSNQQLLGVNAMSGFFAAWGPCKE